jgi:dCTP deaminase
MRICPGDKHFSVKDIIAALTDQHEMGEDGFVLAPGAFLLAWTEETVHLPPQSRVAARVEGKSSLARLGVGIHVTAPIIHAGFDGQIQLEICNHSGLSVTLVPGLRVCQLVFELTLGTPDKGYSGQFLGQHAT